MIENLIDWLVDLYCDVSGIDVAVVESSGKKTRTYMNAWLWILYGAGFVIAQENLTKLCVYCMQRFLCSLWCAR